MSQSKEPVCSQLQQLRKRLDQLKATWDSPASLPQNLGWAGFQNDWRERWTRIVGMLRDVDRMLNGSRMGWDGQPAILRFAPTEGGVVSMGPF